MGEQTAGKRNHTGKNAEVWRISVCSECQAAWDYQTVSLWRIRESEDREQSSSQADLMLCLQSLGDLEGVGCYNQLCSAIALKKMGVRIQDWKQSKKELRGLGKPMRRLPSHPDEREGEVYLGRL